jgi:protein-tyrosine phosphatase
MVYAETVRVTLGQLARACIESGRNVTFFPGQECYYFSGLKELLRKGEVLTLAGGRYVLLEFDPDVPFNYMKQGFRDLQSAGYRIVLAHFERYKCLREEDRLKELKQQDILLQLNYDMLLEKDGVFRKNIWRRYVQDGTVDLLGSDTHGIHFRPIHAAEAFQWLESSVDREIINRILYRNVDRILNSV